MINSVKKPYGLESVWANTKEYYSKMMIITEGERTPYVYHKRIDKTILVLQGIVNLTTEGTTRTLKEGETRHIMPKIMHRVHAVRGDATVLEVGTHYDENDYVIVEDDYSRG